MDCQFQLTVDRLDRLILQPRIQCQLGVLVIQRKALNRVSIEPKVFVFSWIDTEADNHNSTVLPSDYINRNGLLGSEEAAGVSVPFGDG